MSNLIGIANYGLMTFNNTSAALKAEKTLKKTGREFMVIPTPREISASCGLALKFRLTFLQDYCQALTAENVCYDDLYRIEEQHRKKIIQKISMDI